MAPRHSRLTLCSAYSRHNLSGGKEKTTQQADHSDAIVLESGFRLAHTGVPDHDGSVTTPADEVFAVRAKDHAGDRFGVAPERESFLAGGGVPKLDRCVLTG